MARLHRAQLLLLFIEPLSCCCLPSLPPLHLKTCLSGIAATGIYIRGNAPPPQSTYVVGTKGKRMQALTPYEKARNARIASNRQVQCLRMDLLP